jgi:Spy/CpxP family protein refolding chaperone
MKRLAWILMVVVAPALGSQVPGDSGAHPPADAEQAKQLREQIRQRWSEHVRSMLGLSDDQAAKLQATEQRFEEQRQPIRARQRDITQSLNGELSAGTPDQDRVRQLMSQQQENQLKLQQINRDEDREMQGYLTPVQRARYHEERRRFQERVAEIVRHQREERRRVVAPRGGARRRPRP